ncbi:hypothetical protein KC19_11G161900 [Ceratodon purpureus]|uniref:Uncharacterized protein n=1 Tax=Ceratodon purpureus TaxID=3225 RepID=A0A8T0GFS4_CERPU|nr:hypothetical protein KC19_11G161900 [Ceratodon purpureus]
MERLASARPWESRRYLFDNQSASKDVGEGADGHVSMSADVSGTRNAKDTSGDLKQQWCKWTWKSKAATGDSSA